MTGDEVAKVLNQHGLLMIHDWRYERHLGRIACCAGGMDINAMTAVANRLVESLPNGPREPTLDECLAAMNRNEHKGGEWTVSGWSGKGFHHLDEDEIRIIGKHYIDRERAAKA